MSLQQSGIYSNPVWSENMGDPFVLKVRGRYYAYATEPENYPAAESWVFPILTSTDLVHWQKIGKALPALGDNYFFYWAPEVTEYNGQYFLYYSVHQQEFVGAIRVAVADSPEGPFKDSGHDLTSALVPWAIDPHILRDLDGQLYLYMAIEYLEEPGGFIGCGNAVIKLADPFTPVGKLTRVTAPSQPWQLFEAQRKAKGGIDWYTVEGPSILRHRRHYYQTFSGGCYYRNNYAVSYALSNTPMGTEGLQDRSWRDWTGKSTQGDDILLMRGNDQMISPGHNSIVVGPNNTDLYIVYHAWQPDMQHRRMCIDRLFWHGDELWTGAPTATPQPIPVMPHLREYFDTSTALTSWRAIGGQWNIGPGEVRQEDGTSERALLEQPVPLLQYSQNLQYPQNGSNAEQFGATHKSDSPVELVYSGELKKSSNFILGKNWLLEVNLRHVAGEGAYGVHLQGVKKSTQILLTPQAQLQVRSDGAGDDPLPPVSLPGHVVPETWHQLLLSCSGSLLTISFDGLEVLTTVLPETPQKFALLTQNCQAAFSTVSLTTAFRDEFLDSNYTPAQLGWRAEGETQIDWEIQDGALKQKNSTSGTHSIFKGDTQSDFECGVTLKLEASATEQEPAFGMLLQAENGKTLALCLAQRNTRWQLEVKSEEQPLLEQALSEDFEVTHWHTLRVLQQNTQLHIHLDGPEIALVEKTIGNVCYGLRTQNAAVAFTSAWQTIR